MTTQRIAVLGAGGFLGSHLVPALLRLPGVVIEAIDANLQKLECADARVLRRTVRIEEPGLLAELAERCDLLLSLTALCTPALYNTDPLAVIDANYTELVPLVKECARRGKRLIHFSTCEVYGKTALNSDGVPSATMSEDDTALFLGPVSRERWSYACAKQLLERLIWAHGQHAGLEFSIIRPFNVIGPRMDFLPGVDGEGVPRVLASFMDALLRGNELMLVDGGEQKRSFISVDEFVEGVVRVVERRSEARGQIFNLGAPANNVRIRDLAELLGAEFQSQCPSAPAPRLRSISAEEFYGPGYDDSAERVPDIGKAERLLSFAPRVTLSQMLPGIVRDYVTRYRDVLASTEARADGAPASGSRSFTVWEQLGS